MSTPHVLRDTLALAATAGLRAVLLPPWYDIDVADDLRRLAQNWPQAHRKAPTTRGCFSTGWDHGNVRHHPRA